MNPDFVRAWLARVPAGWDLPVLLMLAFALFAAGLGLRDPWPADEPRFALIARDMVLGGQWLIPQVGGEWYSDKPPVFMWAIAFFYWLCGDLRLAFLLPSLLAGLGMLVLVYDLARRLWGRESAVLAALLLLISVQFTEQARTAQIDALVAFWIVLGVYGLVRHLVLGPQWRWYMLAGFAAGVGVITKGVGFLPFLMLLPWAFARRRWPAQWPHLNGSVLRWASAPAFFLLAIALWGVPMLWYVAASSVPELAAYRDDILMRQTAERYFDPWGHHKPFWYYFAEVIPWAWLPFTLLLPWLIPAWRRRLADGDAALWLLLGWVACVLIFFTFSPGKRGVYLLPALPALALAAAPLLSALLQRRGVQRLFLAVVGIFALLGAAALVWTWLAPSDPWSRLAARHDLAAQIPPLLGAAFVFTLAATLLFAAGRRIGGVAAFSLLIAVWWQIYGWSVVPVIDSVRSGSDLMARVERALPADAQLGLVSWKEQQLLHITRPVTHFGFRRPGAAEMRDAIAWLAQEPNRFLLIGATGEVPCFETAGEEPLAFRHRRQWWLLGQRALNGSCEIAPSPLHARVYRNAAAPGS